MSEPTNGSADGQLADIRRRIDEVDEQLQALMNKRATLVQDVGKIKSQQGDEARLYRPAREAEVLHAVAARNQGPLKTETIILLFRELMSACLALEGGVKVAYFGPAGTYTQGAMHKHFGHGVDAIPLPGIAEVFREVESGSVNYGVVPVENSTEGGVTHTLDRLARSPLRICGEVQLPIHHCLLSQAADLKLIKEVRAHAQSLAQCREWLDTYLPDAHRLAVSSNAEAARQTATTPGVAAIAARQAAEVYGLGLLAENIEDEPDNTTRFLVLGKEAVRSTGRDKTSLMLAAANKPGALYRLLEPFSNHGITLTRIESRPSRRSSWDYNFFLDFEGHEEDALVRQALDEVRSEAMIFKVLGSYPRPVY